MSDGTRSARLTEPFQAARARPASRTLSPAGFALWFAIAFAGMFGLAWAYVAAAPMAFLNRDYPLWIAKRTMLDECRLGDVAVFGDSRTVAAIMPAVMTVPVMNFALSGTSPVETFFNVQRALACPTLPKLVVIAHGAMKFTSDSDYWVFDARTGFLNYAEMRAVDADAASVHDSDIADLPHPEQLPMALRERLFSLRFPAFYFDSLVKGFFALRWRHNLTAMQDALQSGGHALFGTAPGATGIAGEGTSDAYTVSPLIDLYFSRTVKMLAERGVPTVVLSMPVSHATHARMRPELDAQFAAYLAAKAAQLPSLRVVGPAIPCWPDRYFGDAWHFNADGAERYSRALDPWLRDVLAGDTPVALADGCADPQLK